MIGHEQGNPDPFYRHMFFLELRECIGKTDDVHESLCMHSSIVAREMAAKGVCVCRVCNCDLSEGKGRYNDHKILRHPECVQPICTKCAKENPDKFHLAFKYGDQIMHNGLARPLYLDCARWMFDIEVINKMVRT
jgi:hypothetical protein